MSRDDSETLLGVAQAATLLGVHPNTIRSWTDAGRLTAYRINARGDRRFRRGDVERLLVEDGVAGGAEHAPDGAGRSVELAAFWRLTRGLAASSTEATVARTIVEVLRTDFEADRVAVYLGSDDHLELVAHAGFDRPPEQVRTAEPVRSEAMTETPLATSRGTLGLLAMDAAAAARAGSFVSVLASSAAATLQNTRLLGTARREVRRARALRAVTNELTGTLDLNALLGEVVDVTRTLFEADKAGLWLLERGEHPFRVAASVGLSDAFLASVAQLSITSETIGVRAISDRRPFWLRDADRVERTGPMRQVYADDDIRTVCLVPLIARDEPLGLLGLYHGRDRTWPEEEVALAQAFGDQAAVAIQNARLYRSIAEQAARIRSIQDLSARLNRLTDVRAIAEAIVAEARTLADYHDIRVYRVNHETATCEPIAFTREMLEGDPDDAEALLRVGVGEGFTGWVADHGEPLLINNALDDPRGQTIVGTDDVPESMLVVPMLYEGRTLGVIVLSQLGFDRFTEDDLQTMSIFAGYAAQAIANATTYGQLVAQSMELGRRADSQRRLLEVNERLLGSLDQGDVLQTIADGLRDVVHYDNLSIYRTDHQKRVMLPVLTRERHAEQVSRYIIPFGLGLMGWAVEHRQPILANDALNDPRSLQIPGTPPDPEAIVVVPLIAEGEVLGALNVSRVGGTEAHFSDSDFELVQLFAGQAGIALRNADAHHAMSQQAETDALTGLGNHGAFQRDLARAIDEAARQPTADTRRLALLMMDLDSFKAYNDRHGHPAGDALLHQVATAIYGAARSDDRVYRYGGDEFALVLTGAGAVEAARVGQRVRRAVGALTARDATPVTITVGVAAVPSDATDRAGLIAAADKALYYGKRSGEDRVVRADELPAELGDLRGTLDELASAALREGDEQHAVEHIVERASHLATHHETSGSLREALLTISRSVDAHGGIDRGHADRVGWLARRVADHLELPEEDRHSVELAARLHALDERGVAEVAEVPSLRDVAEIIGEYRSLIAAGARRKHRASRPRGGVAAHVVALANAYDEHVSGLGRERVGRSEAMELLRADRATFRAGVLDALAAVVAERPDSGRRRRRSDRAAEVKGAA